MQSKSKIQKYSYPPRINLSELVNEAKQQPSLQCEPCITYVITIIIIIVIIIIIIIFLYSFSLLINSSSFNKAMKEGKKRKLLIKVLQLCASRIGQGCSVLARL